MVKRMFLTLTALMTILWSVTCAAAEKANNWLVYWYICGSNLERDYHSATLKISDMEQVKLPPNVKVLIYASGLKSPESDIKEWHHPTLKEGGDGIYLYSSNRLEKLIGKNDNMGDPDTLESFLEYGEENFKADRRIIFFTNHGGLGGVCYDDNFNGDCLTYDELKSAFSNVYGTSPETLPFELIGFDACLTGSYELANSISDFSHYMLGAEPSIWAPPFKDFFAALAKDTSINGDQLGKVFCDSAMKNYSEDMRLTHLLSVIDLSKMPTLREAYESYFDEALKRSDEDEGFIGSFARAAESRNVDKYSNLYTDLGLLAENTKSIMPETSKKLIKAIDESVVYNKRGDYLKSKGISTYYPYISLETSGEKAKKAFDFTNDKFEKNVLTQDANYDAQKYLYEVLLDSYDLPEPESVPVTKNSNGHFVINLSPDQLKNISSVHSILMPVKESNDSKLGIDIDEAVLTSYDDLKTDWNKGTVTEKFSPVEPVFNGHKIVLFPSLSSRGSSFYKVPILHDYHWYRELIVKYDASTQEYSIVGFGSMIENGVVRSIRGKPRLGSIITPIHMTISDDPSNEQIGIEVDEQTGRARTVKNKETGKEQYKYVYSNLGELEGPDGKKYYLKMTKGIPFVYARNSAITNKKITKGHYIYGFAFYSPSGHSSGASAGLINIERGKITRMTLDEINAENND